MQQLVGRSHTFPDGDRLEITQIKIRDNGEPFVTFAAHSGPGVPRKQVMSLSEFQGFYGHLFPEK
jgi:hypothetical protein